MYSTILFLMSAPDGKSQGGGMVNLIILALAMLVFYFLMIRPRNRQIKKQREFLNKLERGLRIVTTAGIHAKISRLNDDNTIDVEISPGTYVKMEKSAISLEMTEQAQKSLTLNIKENPKDENKQRHNNNNNKYPNRDKVYHNRSDKNLARNNNRNHNREENKARHHHNKLKTDNLDNTSANNTKPEESV